MVLVTMPRALATMVVRKAANFVRQLRNPILGVIENMSYLFDPTRGNAQPIRTFAVDEVAELAQAPVLPACRSRPA